MTALRVPNARGSLSRLALALLTATVGTATACTEAGGGPDGTAAANGSAGAAGSTPPLAGFSGGSSSASGSGGAPVMSTGGGGGNGGSAPLAGSSGAAGADMSSAGQSGSAEMGGTGGAGSASPMVDAGGPMPSPTPSAGCESSAGRPAGGSVTVAQTYYLKFPERYDGTQPFPVLVGFHGCGAVNRGTTIDDTEWIRLTDGREFETEYVLAVPQSADSGGCWNYNTDIVRVKQMYDDLLADHCVDTSRVFGTGHSSGAQFIVQILTANHVGDAQHLSFKAVAPVAASDYGAMTGPIPVMYIQGMMDAERGNGDGHETVERFRAANSCGSSSMPYSEVAGCQSGATSVDPGCVIYDDCEAPTIWCSHNDPAYSGTMHGVPCFAMTAMHDFFTSLM